MTRRLQRPLALPVIGTIPVQRALRLLHKPTVKLHTLIQVVPSQVEQRGIAVATATPVPTSLRHHAIRHTKEVLQMVTSLVIMGNRAAIVDLFPREEALGAKKMKLG